MIVLMIKKIIRNTYCHILLSHDINDIQHNNNYFL